MKVTVKKLAKNSYEIIEGTDLIQDKVWGGCMVVGGFSKEVKFFHPSWLERVAEICRENGYELLIQD